MRLVLQRVKEARVTVDQQVVGAIGIGWLVLVGIGSDDDKRDVSLAVEKTLNLRSFADADGKLNLSILDIAGEILAVSQFTLFGDCRKGRRPSFSSAATPQNAERLYHAFVEELREKSGLKIATGRFQAMMEVALINDGPVTLLVDTKKVF